MSNRFSTNHEDVRLDSQTAAQVSENQGDCRCRLRRATSRLSCRQDLRAPNYRAEEVIDGGIVREVPMARVNTYKGSVVGMPDADARFTVDDDHRRRNDYHWGPVIFS